MIFLQPIIDQINALLEQNTDASTTYAALEARLALEKICYDRLRQRHDYISHADLKSWTPRYVIKTIMQEVDEHVDLTVKFLMSKKNAVPGVVPQDDDFVEIGSQTGFKPKYIASLWQALSNLALHVRIPENRNDTISAYNDESQIRRKVEEVLAELNRLSAATMSFSGIGEVVSFDCICGQKNKRRAELLKYDQTISCFNESCSRGYKVAFDADGHIQFKLDSVEIPCGECNLVTLVPRRELARMKYEQPKIVRCLHCEHENVIKWVLARAALPADNGPNDADS